MIKNGQQLSVTKSQKDSLMRALTALESKDASDPSVPVRIEFLKTDISRLEKQISDYLQQQEG